MFASISARRLNADPEPWVWANGTRHRSTPTLEQDAATRLHRPAGRTVGVEYAPRAEYTPVQVHAVNPLLNVSRDNAGDSDVWGWAMGWAFAANAVLEYLGEPVAAERGYRASFAGAAADLTDGSWEGAATIEALGLGEYVRGDDDDPEVRLFDPSEVDAQTWRDAAAYAEHAARVLDRYLAACKRAGLDY